MPSPIKLLVFRRNAPGRNGFVAAVCASLLLAGMGISYASTIIGEPSPYRLQLVAPGEYRLEPAQEKASPSKQQELLAALPYAKEVEKAARSNDLDPALVHALIHVESRHHATAVSSKGAQGLMQVMPDTADQMGVKKAGDSVAANLEAGSRYLAYLMRMFDKRVDLVLAGYNAGPMAVIRNKMAVPPYPETRAYVPNVLAKYRELTVVPEKPGRVSVVYLPGTRLNADALEVLSAMHGETSFD